MRSPSACVPPAVGVPFRKGRIVPRPGGSVRRRARTPRAPGGLRAPAGSASSPMFSGRCSSVACSVWAAARAHGSLARARLGPRRPGSALLVEAGCARHAGARVGRWRLAFVLLHVHHEGRGPGSIRRAPLLLTCAWSPSSASVRRRAGPTLSWRAPSGWRRSSRRRCRAAVPVVAFSSHISEGRTAIIAVTKSA